MFVGGGGAGWDAQAAAAAILNDAAATAFGCVAAAQFGMNPGVDDDDFNDDDDEEELAPPWKLELAFIRFERPFAIAPIPAPPPAEALNGAP